jgi:hypothetical protein
MVPLKWSENRETLFLGPIWCAGNGVPMRTLTNKEIIGNYLSTMKPPGSSINKPGFKYINQYPLCIQALFKTGATDPSFQLKHLDK